jgi:hypothetical protein
MQNFGEFTYQEAKRCMLAFLKLASYFSRGSAHPAMQPQISATHPILQHKDRSPGSGAPTRSGSRAALTWTALWLGVDVDNYPCGSRAPLASYPRTTLNVVDTSLKASHAGALLVRTPSCSSHDLMP